MTNNVETFVEVGVFRRGEWVNILKQKLFSLSTATPARISIGSRKFKRNNKLNIQNHIKTHLYTVLHFLPINGGTTLHSKL